VILADPGARRTHGSRRRSIGRLVLVALLIVLTFLVGIAFARTLDERPKAGGVVTSVRTLTPLPQRAATTRTVTVTVTTP
jgi:hypothetical protein